MSFILDALKKSETERQRADAPALYEMKMAPPRRGVAVWLIVLAALLVINVIVLSVVLLRGTHGSSQIDAGAVATPPSAPAAATAYPTAPTAPPPALAAPANPTPTPATASDPASAANTASSEAADDAPAVEPPHGNGSANAGAGTGVGGTGEVPTYAQAASVPGANLPELKLDLHAYAKNPADRFVFLNMTRLKEGQSTPSGVRVESITPEGAVLSWQGSRFFLQRE
jgi:general secretion pathway protein B